MATVRAPTLNFGRDRLPLQLVARRGVENSLSCRGGPPTPGDNMDAWSALADVAASFKVDDILPEAEEEDEGEADDEDYDTWQYQQDDEAIEATRAHRRTPPCLVLAKGAQPLHSRPHHHVR